MNKWVWGALVAELADSKSQGPGPCVKPGVLQGMSEAVRTRFMARPTAVLCHTDEPERRRPLWLSLRRSVGLAVARHVWRPAPGGVRLRRRRPGPARPGPARPPSPEPLGAAAALPGLRVTPSGAPARVSAGGRGSRSGTAARPPVFLRERG